MNQKRLRLLLLLGFIVISAGIVGIIAFITNNATKTDSSYTQSEYYDPATGQNLNETQGKTPEKVGVNPDAPSYNGFSILLDRGLTQDDINAIVDFITSYNSKLIGENKDKISSVSLYKDSVEHKITDSVDIYTMRLLVDRTEGYTVQTSSDEFTNITYNLYKGIDASTSPIYTLTKDL